MWWLFITNTRTRVLMYSISSLRVDSILLFSVSLNLNIFGKKIKPCARCFGLWLGILISFIITVPFWIGIIKIDNFYLDCNSIIYDTIVKIDFKTIKEDETELICKNVFLKIDEYVNVIKPTQNLFIAFDGVAPVAKLDQQQHLKVYLQLFLQLDQNLKKL
jgi:uncharacterized membrane protein